MALNVAAAFASTSNTLITFPTAFTVLHLIAGALAALACWKHRLFPLAVAISAGTFVGRSLSIWTAIVTDSAGGIPHATLALAGLQWLALAWVIRPSTIRDIPGGPSRSGER